MNNPDKPELLAPAGDLEKLKTAVLFGADAVYAAGKNLGLRANTKNFGPEELVEGVAFAHGRGAKVYVAANIFAGNADFDGMEEYFRFLGDIGVDALIISDPGIFDTARKAVPAMPIHISTQQNNTNSRSALFWRRLGAKRAVLARELSLGEIREIHDASSGTGLELETFVHGAMCIAYSGRCLLSHYMTGRDANRGECAHPCRYEYSLVEKLRPDEAFPIEEDGRGAYIMNSKDLCMIRHIPELINAGIASFKIEGRVKTPFYVASVVKAYREAIDDYFAAPELYESKLDYYTERANIASHREISTGFLMGDGSPLQVYDDCSYIRMHNFLGIVRSFDRESGTAEIEQKNRFAPGDTVEFLRSGGQGFSQRIGAIYGPDGEELAEANRPRQTVVMKVTETLCEFDIMYKRIP